MDTVAVIGSCDTKAREVAYMRELLEAWGLNVLVIDVATGPGPSENYDISREAVAEAAGASWETVKTKTKGEKIEFMTKAVAVMTRNLYQEGKIQGILSAGGLQNTVMATSAMRALPIGFPKVMATTVACGKKTFDLVVGDKDIVVIPSICDFTGLNMVTRQIMANACACCAGMVKHAGTPLKKGNRLVVGITLMGITNTGACAAVDELERMGIETLGFHSTGVGGAIMEQMAADGLLDGILDLTTHEITQEYFKAGFSYGEDAKYRLVKGVQHKVPLVICPGGLDFIDFDTKEFPPRMNERIYMYHNANTAHIKILPDEAEITTERVVERINRIDYPVKLLLPTDGMRHNTRKGEELYCKEVDDIILGKLRAIKNPNVDIITVPGNIDTEEWGIQAARYMVQELKEAGKFTE
ncbi:Tm-1-like ATP-binding domain-containing protein [Faecalicatena fissicatena]|uniref:Tm-1-like ATP-binding domain-containing protein n=1 Tax=Faecalicatena fissicatena TaxID=290055 RepID=A0ABS2EBR4_9FIRM|nr:Tm-1-like ATP-binding domain-containing protein [Faecalicatena fissicatena]MBM6739085.1 Tm-1-like ATP-binding domain-containing protein [Faecalicatena fissicatena]